MRTRTLLLSLILPLAACAGAPRPAARRAATATRVAPAPAEQARSADVSADAPAPAPVPAAPAPPRVVRLALGGNASLAVWSDGSVSTWGGSDGVGHLALDNETRHATAVKVPGIADAIDAATGGDSACALLKDKSLRCWGRMFSNTAPTTPPIGQVNQIAMSDLTACALLVGGTVSCWDWTSAPKTQGPPGAQAVAIGSLDRGFTQHPCAIRTNGTVACWGMWIGSNWVYWAGSGDEKDPNLFHVGLHDPGLRDVTKLRVSPRHACALAQKELYCWGFNEVGQLGTGKRIAVELFPKKVQGMTDVEDVAVGSVFTCAKRTNGTVACWGGNGAGELGLGDTRARPLPTDVPGLTDVDQIAAGDRHACALKKDGSVVCWGWNPLGQIGNGTFGRSSSVPVPVAGLTPSP